MFYKYTVHVCRGRVNSHSLIEWTSQGLARKTEAALCVLHIKKLIENQELRQLLEELGLGMMKWDAPVPSLQSYPTVRGIDTGAHWSGFQKLVCKLLYFLGISETLFNCLSLLGQVGGSETCPCVQGPLENQRIGFTFHPCTSLPSPLQNCKILGQFLGLGAVGGGANLAVVNSAHSLLL